MQDYKFKLANKYRRGTEYVIGDLIRYNCIY